MSQTRSGYRRSPGGLIGAILACLALIATIWLLTRFQGAGGEDVDPAPTIDYADTLALARSQAPFEVLSPRPEPRGWRATSVDWELAGPVRTWRLGFITSSEEFAGLTQSNDSSGEVVEDATRADQPGAPVTIDGDTWQTLTSDEDERALVYVDNDGVTTVVTGTASEDELVTFVESLSTE